MLQHMLEACIMNMMTAAVQKMSRVLSLLNRVMIMTLHLFLT